jgi:hypothetical protein
MLQRDHALGRFMFADEDDARRWSEFRLLLTLRGSQRGDTHVAAYSLVNLTVRARLMAGFLRSSARTLSETG